MGARTDVQIHESIGSVTGTVEAIAMRPHPHFSLRDRLSNRLVKVYAYDEVIEQILQAFGRTVTVGGRVRWRADGVALTIHEVDNLLTLPTIDEIPPPETFLGALPNLMGGLTFDEYMDHIRGRDDE